MRETIKLDMATNGAALPEPDHERLTEVMAGLATLVVLFVVEGVLYGGARLSEDSADIVTLSAFGGVAAAGARNGLPPERSVRGQIVASSLLGVVAALAVLHGARKQADVGPFAFAVGITSADQWSFVAAVLPAVLMGCAVAIVSWCIQAIVDYEFVRRIALIGLVVIGGGSVGAAAGLGTGYILLGAPSVFKPPQGPYSAAVVNLTVPAVITVALLAATSGYVIWLVIQRNGRLRALQPEAALLRKKYKNDPQKLQEELLKLYRERRIGGFARR